MRTPTRQQAEYWTAGLVKYARLAILNGGYGRRDSAAMAAVCFRQLFWLYPND